MPLFTIFFGFLEEEESLSGDIENLLLDESSPALDETELFGCGKMLMIKKRSLPYYSERNCNFQGIDIFLGIYKFQYVCSDRDLQICR